MFGLLTSCTVPGIKTDFRNHAEVVKLKEHA